MAIKSFLFKAGVAVAPLLLMLALGGEPVAQAAGSTIVVANTPNPTDCGRFHTADTSDLVDTLNGAVKGKILICPGIYNLSGLDDINIQNAKGLTIAQAVVIKGLDTRPRIVVDSQTPVGISVKDSTNVTINGLVIDSSGNTADGHKVIAYDHTSGKVLNTTLLGSATTDSAIDVQNLHDVKRLSLTIQNDQLRGFITTGLAVRGPYKVTVKNSLVDTTDAGRLPASSTQGVAFLGDSSSSGPSGSVTASTLQNNGIGVFILESSKISVSKNKLTNNGVGVQIESDGVSHVTNGNKVTGNTISMVPDLGAGVIVIDTVGGSVMLKNTISKNVIRAVQPAGTQLGIEFAAPAPALTTMTGTVAGNTVLGFAPGNGIVNLNGFAAIKVKSNTVSP